MCFLIYSGSNVSHLLQLCDACGRRADTMDLTTVHGYTGAGLGGWRFGTAGYAEDNVTGDNHRNRGVLSKGPINTGENDETGADSCFA